MPVEKNANSYRREVAARLKKLADFGPMVDGSLVVVRRRCGNPRCRCARGHKHPAHYLMRKVGGKTHSLYIPVDLARISHQLWPPVAPSRLRRRPPCELSSTYPLWIRLRKLACASWPETRMGALGTRRLSASGPWYLMLSPVTFTRCCAHAQTW